MGGGINICNTLGGGCSTAAVARGCFCLAAKATNKQINRQIDRQIEHTAPAYYYTIIKAHGALITT